MPGYPDFFGTPLVHGINFLAPPNTTLNVPAASSRTFDLLCSHPGYFIDIFATIANAAATVPFYQVEFKWMDSGGAATIDIQHYILAASSTGPWRTCGKGPNRGQLIAVTITNFDPAFAITVNYTIGETTQHIARDDWRTVDYYTASVPGFGVYNNTPKGLAPGDMSAGVLCIESDNNIGAGVTWSLLLPLYTGLVLWQFNANAAISVSVRTPPAYVNIPNWDGDAPAWFDATMTDVTVQVAHPRAPLYVQISNGSGSVIPQGAFGIMVENCS